MYFRKFSRVSFSSLFSTLGIIVILFTLSVESCVSTITLDDVNNLCTPFVIVSPKVYLQGALLNPNLGEETLMRDDLRVANLIPTTSPYPDGLTCDASVFNTTGANAVVDWVFVELRDALTGILESTKATSVSPVNQIVCSDFSITTSQLPIQYRFTKLT